MPKLTEAENWQGWKLMRLLLMKHDFAWTAALAELGTHTENPGHTRTFNDRQREKVMGEARKMDQEGCKPPWAC